MFPVPPVFVQIKVCTTEGVAREHLNIECRVDPDFALVGGGAKAEADPEYRHPYLELTPFLTESRPLDGRTWQASSRDHLLASQHTLTVYAIGMRLEGVNTEQLRQAIRWKQYDVNTNTGTIHENDGWQLLGGGAQSIADVVNEDSPPVCLNTECRQSLPTKPEAPSRVDFPKPPPGLIFCCYLNPLA